MSCIDVRFDCRMARTPVSSHCDNYKVIIIFLFYQLIYNSLFKGILFCDSHSLVPKFCELLGMNISSYGMSVKSPRYVAILKGSSMKLPQAFAKIVRGNSPNILLSFEMIGFRQQCCYPDNFRQAAF